MLMMKSCSAIGNRWGGACESQPSLLVGLQHNLEMWREGLICVKKPLSFLRIQALIESQLALIYAELTYDVFIA